MAQTGYTPISLYYSTTASAVPTAGNLASGELAINITDGKLYYKNNGGTVTLLASAGGAISPITNNGVVYINSSGQATSGSALTFDGSTLSVGETSAGKNIKLFSSSVGNNGLLRFYDTGSTERFQLGVSTTLVSNYAPASTSYAWYIDSEQMRLTSTGLGIGTSSPAVKLDVAGALRSIISGGTPIIYFNNGSSQHSISNSSGSMPFAIDGTTRMTLDSSGNLGLGVTPSAWGSSYTALQLKNGGSIATSTGDLTFVGVQGNAFRDATGYKYVATEYASQYYQSGGAHIWRTAPSGTAGNAITFTQAMTLDASGNLMLAGTTNDGRRLTVNGNTNDLAGIGITYVGVAASSIAVNSSGALTFNLNNSDGKTERARIDSSGNLLVGTTSGATDRGTFASPTASVNVLGLVTTDDSSGGNFIMFRNSAYTLIGSVARVTTTNAVVYNTTSDYRLKTVTGAVTGQGARIDALKPIDYQWTEGGEQARGFLAHEFETVYPNSVSGTKDAIDADGNPVYQAMQAATSEVIADLVAEIQSLRKRLADAGI